MAERLAKSADYGQYQAYPYTSSQSSQGIDSASHGHFIGGIFVGTLGTGLSISLYNGSTLLTTFVPSLTGYQAFPATADNGLKVAIAGTGFNVTILAMDMAV